MSTPCVVGPGVDGSQVKKLIFSSRQNWFLSVVISFDNLVKEIIYFAIINNGQQISANKIEVLNCNRNTFPPNVQIFQFIYHQPRLI